MSRKPDACPACLTRKRKVGAPLCRKCFEALPAKSRGELARANTDWRDEVSCDRKWRAYCQARRAALRVLALKGVPA